MRDGFMFHLFSLDREKKERRKKKANEKNV